MPVLTALGVIGSLGAGAFGAVQSAIANNRARKEVQNQRDKNRQWYEQRMAEDYTQRSDVQAVFNQQRQLLQDQYKQARATQAVAGGSDEAVALQQQAANDAMAQTMSNVAAGASAHKDNVEQQYMQRDAQLSAQQAQMHQQQAAATAQAAGQAISAGLNLVGTGMDIQKLKP